ncbi:hypothetical protein GCM10009774_15290 [Cellulomonas gelida]|nr:hypothetical protein GCM10009774_15290 [Cellulomonas gelida]
MQAEPATSLARTLLRDALEELAHLGLVEAAVPAERADGRQLAGLGPARDRLRVDAEQDRDLARGQQRALLQGGSRTGGC